MSKKFLFVLILMSFVSISSMSQVILDENFSYPTGDSLTAHNWVWVSSYVNTLTVATGNLTFPGYANSNIGGYVRVHNNGQDAYRQHDSVSSGSVYFAFLVNVDSVQAAGDYFFALLPNSSTTNYTARTFAKDSSGLRFGITKSTGAVTYSSTTYSLNTTYLIVVKYTFMTGSNTDDEMRLWVISGTIPATEPAPTVGPVTNTAVTDAPNISRFVIRQGSASNAPTLWIDGYRVASSWSNIPTALMPVGTTTPSQYSLKQNYPNPFNPSTNIEFSVPKSSFVTLKVYDALGREVRSLVNENLAAGTYRAQFEASNLASGMYYYKMTAIDEATKSSFVDTKPMVLVK